jgi:protein phosphatase
VALRTVARTHVGLVRSTNEDAFLVQPPLYAVADGIGGHAAGEVASSLAIESLTATLVGTPSPEGLRSGMRRANRDVLDAASRDPRLRGMGTTLTAVLAEGKTAWLAHLGDSRAYLQRQGGLQRLTEDDNLAGRLVRETALTSEEAESLASRNALTQALGLEDEISIQEVTVPLAPEDRLLLCTDGLSSVVSEDVLRNILVHEQDVESACDRLIEAAKVRGAPDNVTVVLMQVLPT